MLRALHKVLPLRRAGLDARLTGVNGFTGRGEIAFTEWRSGEKTLDIALRGIAGKSAAIYAGDRHVADIAVVNGRAAAVLNTRKGDALPDLTPQIRLDVRQNGDVILSGNLA